MNRFTLAQMMKLPKLSEFIMPSNREFYPEKLITDLGLYEAVLIDTADLQVITEFIGGEPPHLEVSKDVAAFNKFINFSKQIMLPCPDCKQNQPFSLSPTRNPRRIGEEGKPRIVKIRDVHSSEGTGACGHNVFDNPHIPKYNVGEDFLQDYDQSMFQSIDFDFFQYRCSSACMDIITEEVGEIRRDFYCAYESAHRGFVDFVIYEAVDRFTKPEILENYEARKASDPNAEMTDDETKMSHYYGKLKTCLIMEKVGQFPSIADLQMFDIEKYRKVLSKESFRDFKMALGLYSAGVGCGSFVYLRRIFEGLITEAASIASKSVDWNEEEYKKKRTNEKIDYLELFNQKLIPDELSSVKTKIYGVLSRGIHGSSDQECKELFPIMKYIIEELLDHKIAKKDKEEKLKQMKSVLCNIKD